MGNTSATKTFGFWDYLIAIGLAVVITGSILNIAVDPVSDATELAGFKWVGIGVAGIVLLGAFALSERIRAKREGRRSKSFVFNTLPALFLFGLALYGANWIGNVLH